MARVAVGAYARAGSAARRAAALIAVLRSDHPAERVDPALVVRVLRDHHEREPIVVTEADVDAMRSVAVSLRSVLGAADAAAAAEQLNVLLVRAPGSPRLSYDPSVGWRMEPDDVDPWDVDPGHIDQEVGDQGVGDQGVGDQEVGDQGVGDQGVGDQGVGDQGVGDRDGARPAAGRAGRPTWTSWFAGSSALAFARLMVDRQVKPGGLCAAVGCGTPFADLGRGDPRRYCSPRCATRERVAAHRRRQATDAH